MNAYLERRLLEVREAYYALVEGTDVAPNVDEATRCDLIETLRDLMDELRKDDCNEDQG